MHNEFIIAFNITVEKKDQTISVILSELVKTAIDRLLSTGFNQGYLG